jgi:myo-inositol 2-dehydrogenase/D-chiro-inositol 1-dehydrogenase
MTVQVGVIGVGGMGACHARHITELAGAELGWIADPDEATGAALGADFDCEWIADGMDKIGPKAGGAVDCDAVVIACPDRFHHRYVMAALERGLPILAEKPLTVELQDAREIVEAEVAHGRRFVQLGFMRVYDDRHVQVAAALSRIGRPLHIRAVHRNTNDGSRTVGQMLVESIIHDIHTVRWLSGQEIVSVATSVVPGGAGTRMILVTCRLADGAIAVLEFDDIATGYEVSVEVTAERGNVIAAEPLRAAVRTDGMVTGEIGDDWFTPFLDTYRVEMRDFVSSVEAGASCGPSAWDGYAAQAVVEAATASAVADGAPKAVELSATPSLYISGNEGRARS